MSFLLSRRWVLFALVVAALAFVAFRLGEWQFSRQEQREAGNAIVARNLEAPPVPVAEVLAVDEPVAAEEEWLRVTATGRYLDRESVVVRYQTRDGQSGVDVVTPLLTDSGTALLVNRGWAATGNVGTTRPDVPAAQAGEVTVVGWVRADAAPDDSTVVTDRSTRAISSEQIGAALDVPVYRGFVELDTETPEPGEPLAKTDTPDLGEGVHFFYGLQWWFFAALAVFGFGYLAWDERRKARRSSAAGSSGAAPGRDDDARETAGAARQDSRS